MKHFGDIASLSGYELPIVDVITGGSPCQDLSVAGNRAGLAGERSGLFMEQIRIVKEMRERDRRDNGRSGWAVRPRFMVWENVKGAFTSNGGQDFQTVLTEIVRIAEPESPVVPLPDGRRWPYSGCLYSDVGAWSIAWRLHDAQFWGVPQRRERIALVADFGGLSAPEVLFERKGLSRDSEPSRTQREETPGGVGSGAANTSGSMTGWDCQSKRIFSPDGICATLNSGDREGGNITPSVFCLQGNGIDRADTAGCNGKGWTEDVSYTLNTIDRPAVTFSFDSLANNSMKSKNPNSGCREVEVSKTLDCFDSNPSKNQGGIAVVQKVYDARGNGDGSTVPTLTGVHQNRVTDYTALCIGNGQLNQMSMAEQANTLDTMHDQQAVMVAAVDCRNGVENGEINGTLQAGQNLNSNNVCRCGSVVRRLTPKKCERLQGMPDDWSKYGINEKGEVYELSDTARYVLQGNGIARPFWTWLLRRIAAQYERPATLGSLFSGQSSFELSWQEVGGIPVWCSEIEKNAVAVSKYHFPDEGSD